MGNRALGMVGRESIRIPVANATEMIDNTVTPNIH